jgi:heme exporter protein B
MLKILSCIIRRDLLLAMRRRSDVLTTLMFFVIVASLFPLAVGPDKALLRTMAPGIVWIGALLASMLALGRLFALDYADGTLEQMLLTNEPLSVIVIGKVLAHWLTTGFPMVLVAPLLALQFDLPAAAIGTLCGGLLLGTPVFSLLGAIGAALTLGVRGSNVLIALLVLPLSVPILIFGAGAIEAGPSRAAAHLLLLGAALAASAALAPWAAAAALRIALE